MFDTMKPEKRNLIIEQMIRAEWEMMRSVEGIGGKAGCQEEWPTFHIMRYSYLFAWSDQMLRSYMKDLDEAFQSKRNLVMEKYAHMMEDTDPEYYRTKLELHLPKHDEETTSMISEITEYMIGCDKELALKYPKLGGKSRPIEAAKDSGTETSAETYVKGELKTYSRFTIKFFLDYIRTCKAEGVNIAFLIKDKMVKMYGYDSLEDAERKM